MIYRLLIISLFTCNLYGQTNFPEDWLGKWHGQMLITQAGQDNQDTVDVTLILDSLSADRTTYTMVYAEGKYPETIKSYEIIRIDTSLQNLYLMDEKNGILLDMRLLDDCFYSFFDVAGSRLANILCLKDDHISFEIFSARLSERRVTTNETDKVSEIFEVESVSPFTVQKATLKRVH